MYDNAAYQVLMARRSARAFLASPLPAKTLDAIVQAGQSAPYVTADCRHFTVINDRLVIERLISSATSFGVTLGDDQREQFGAPGWDGSYGAPTVVIVSGNPESLQHLAVCAASVENMLIAAESFGVGSCWAYYPIFAFHSADADEWLRELQIPEGFEPVAAVLLGWALHPAESGDDQRYKNTVTYI